MRRRLHGSGPELSYLGEEAVGSGLGAVILALTVSRKVAVSQAAALVASGGRNSTCPFSRCVSQHPMVQPPANGPTSLTCFFTQGSGAVLLGPDGAMMQTGPVSSNAGLSQWYKVTKRFSPRMPSLLRSCLVNKVAIHLAPLSCTEDCTSVFRICFMRLGEFLPHFVLASLPEARVNMFS